MYVGGSLFASATWADSGSGNSTTYRYGPLTGGYTVVGYGFAVTSQEWETGSDSIYVPPASLPDPPPPPSDIQFGSWTQTSFYCTCSASTGATYYEWYIDGQLGQTGTSRSCTFSGLSPGGSYSIGVRACNEGGCSTMYSETGKTCPPNTARITYPEITHNSVRIALSSGATGAEGYWIYDSDGNQIGDIGRYDTLLVQYLMPLTTYSFGVVAYRKIVAGVYITSDIAYTNVTTAAEPVLPSPTTDIYFSSWNTTEFKANCAYAADADYYFWYLNGQYYTTTISNSTMVTFSGLSAGTNYTVELKQAMLMAKAALQ